MWKMVPSLFIVLVLLPVVAYAQQPDPGKVIDSLNAFRLSTWFRSYTDVNQRIDHPGDYEREKLLEGALLEQLHPVIYPSLQRIFKVAYPQYTSTRIVDIDCTITGSRPIDESRPADAIGGAKVYRLLIEVQMKGESNERVLLTLDNSSPQGLFMVGSYEVQK